MLNKEEIKNLELLDSILASISRIKLDCMGFEKVTKNLHGELQILLNAHNEFPKIFKTDKNLKKNVTFFIELLTDFSDEIGKVYFFQLENAKLGFIDAISYIKSFSEISELTLYKSEMISKITFAELELLEIKRLKENLKSYLDYHLRTLKKIAAT